jgi:hypothetical protein
VPGDAGISKVRQCAVYQQAVGVANAASLNPDANLIGAGFLQRPANLSEDAGFADFNCSVRCAHIASA